MSVRKLHGLAKRGLEYVFSLAIDFSSVGQDAGWKRAIRAGETPATQGHFAWLNTYGLEARGTTAKMAVIRRQALLLWNEHL